MPLGFDPPHPGGMTENSPTFQRWVREFRGAQVPKGRLKSCAIRQPSLRDLSCCGRWFPTLKRWAIIACPSGTKTWPGFAGILWDQILARIFHTRERRVRARGLQERRRPLVGRVPPRGAPLAFQSECEIAGLVALDKNVRAPTRLHY